MHEMLHFIGLCPDAFSHTNLIEMVVTNHQTVNELINNNIKSYAFKFTPGRTILADKQSRKQGTSGL
jgi:hypothetical protein